MKREEEIEIILRYLKEDMKKTCNEYSSLVLSTMVRNGKLVEYYQDELEKIRN